MFGENNATYDLVEELLEIFDLEEIFEMNDLSPEDVLRILLEGGYLGEPAFVIEKYEDSEEE